MTLNVGEYEIPNDCRAIVAGGKVYVFYRLNKGRPKDKRLRLKIANIESLGIIATVVRHIYVSYVRKYGASTKKSRLMQRKNTEKYVINLRRKKNENKGFR